MFPEGTARQLDQQVLHLCAKPGHAPKHFRLGTFSQTVQPKASKWPITLGTRSFCHATMD
jgi:hypothetical protein